MDSTSFFLLAVIGIAAVVEIVLLARCRSCPGDRRGGKNE